MLWPFQILVSDLWALFEGQGRGRFDDIDTLTMFADYRVPQSLQVRVEIYLDTSNKLLVPKGHLLLHSIRGHHLGQRWLNSWVLPSRLIYSSYLLCPS